MGRTNQAVDSFDGWSSPSDPKDDKIDVPARRLCEEKEDGSRLENFQNDAARTMKKGDVTRPCSFDINVVTFDFFYEPLSA